MNIKKYYFIRIFFIIIFIIFNFYIFSGERISYLFNPISLLFFFISLILLIILEIINKLINDKKINFLKIENKKIINKKTYKYTFIESSDKVDIIDHGFDGILELNNNLPTWWIDLFYLTIMFSLSYFIAYIFTDFSHPDIEYQISYNKQLKDVKNYEMIRPQITLEKSFFNKDSIEEGKILFKENCATCHENDGKGNIGPNLTDDYWINIEEKNLFKNIFHIIWYGSKNNLTMRNFGESGEIKGNDIQKISSYVYYINQNILKPKNGKPPEGKKVIWDNK